MAQDQIKQAKEMIDQFVRDAQRKRNEDDRRFLMTNIGNEIGKTIIPLIKSISDNARLNKEDFKELVSYLKAEFSKIEMQMPDIKIPEIKVPEPKVTVNVPPIRIPDI